MKNIYKISIVSLVVIFLSFSVSTTILGQTSGASVQTNSATTISNYQVTLNGLLSNVTSYASNYVYFQWGTTISYGNETPQQFMGYGGTFSQNILNLNLGTLYHFRAVSAGAYGTIYGQDMVFTTSGSGNYYGNGLFSASKKAINLTSGNLNWSNSITANPSDIVSFSITLQASGQDVHNVTIRDIMPVNLTYKGNLTLNNSNYSGSIISGVNIGTVYANQPVIIAYQAQVAPVGSLNFGSNVLTNSATITSTEVGAQTTTASILVNRTSVQGATDVSTGLTNNFLTDSFFLPLLIIMVGLWLYFSGKAYAFADWMKL